MNNTNILIPKKGKTVDFAQFIESKSRPSKILVSERTQSFLKNDEKHNKYTFQKFEISIPNSGFVDFFLYDQEIRSDQWFNQMVDWQVIPVLEGKKENVDFIYELLGDEELHRRFSTFQK